MFLLICVQFQETFEASLSAFEQEGIANITALKDQLLEANHVQAAEIEHRHNDVMKRYIYNHLFL